MQYKWSVVWWLKWWYDGGDCPDGDSDDGILIMVLTSDNGHDYCGNYLCLLQVMMNGWNFWSLQWWWWYNCNMMIMVVVVLAIDGGYCIDDDIGYCVVDFGDDGGSNVM